MEWQLLSDFIYFIQFIQNPSKLKIIFYTLSKPENFLPLFYVLEASMGQFYKQTFQRRDQIMGGVGGT
jgi:hypothetical protein